MVRLDCTITLKYDARVPSTFVFNIEPAASPQQTIVKERVDIRGEAGMCDGIINYEGTRLLRVPAVGALSVQSHFVVDVAMPADDADRLYENQPRSLPLPAMPYLYPSRHCESDKLMPTAQQLFGWQVPGYRRIAAISRWVRDHVRQDGAEEIGAPRSAAEALASGRGGPRERAHLMIAFCRALNVPARFVSGIDHDASDLAPSAAARADFHAYVEVFLSDRWCLFDPSSASAPTAMIRLGTGRDAADTAHATIFGKVNLEAPVLTVRTVAAATVETLPPLPAATIAAARRAGAAASPRPVTA